MSKYEPLDNDADTEEFETKECNCKGGYLDNGIIVYACPKCRDVGEVKHETEIDRRGGN